MVCTVAANGSRRIHIQNTAQILRYLKYEERQFTETFWKTCPLQTQTEIRDLRAKTLEPWRCGWARLGYLRLFLRHSFWPGADWGLEIP